MAAKLKLGKLEVETSTSLSNAYLFLKNMITLVKKEGCNMEDILEETEK